MSDDLQPDRERRADWLARANAAVQAWLDGLASAPAMGPDDPGAALAGLDPSIQESARPLDDALEWLDRAKDVGLQPAVPGYLAYVPGGGIFASALASLLSLSLNRFTGIANASPALARIEHAVVDFLLSELGLPAGGAGYLPSGGSLANFTAVVTARIDRLGETGDFSRATIHTSREVHRSVLKAARLAGIPRANIREVAVDDTLRMDLTALEASLAADRAAGMTSFLVVSSGGTVNTGVVDPLHGIADLAAAYGAWHHVDAAYGGAFALVPEGRARLTGIERADSITLDPHKGFFLPYGTGCLLVRDARALRRAHVETASYLEDLAEASVTRSTADYGPELSRNDRGILLWLPLWLHGAGAFRTALAEKLELARVLYAGLEELPLELPFEPELSIVVFRLPREDGESLADWDRRNRAFLGRINQRRRIHLSSTRLPSPVGQALTPRACIMSFRTHREHIERALEDIERAIT